MRRRRRAPSASGGPGPAITSASSALPGGGNTIGSYSTSDPNSPGLRSAAINSVAPPIEWPKATSGVPSPARRASHSAAASASSP